MEVKLSWHGLNTRNVTEEMKKFVARGEYPDLCRRISHERLTGITMANVAAMKAGGAPYVASDEMLTYIHDGFLRHELGRIRLGDDCRVKPYAGDEYQVLKQRFDQTVWPNVAARARENPGMVQFLLEQGIHSSLIIPFMYNEQHCLAKAVAPAHFVGFDCLDQPKLILPHEAMFPFCLDPSYRMIDGRTVKAQEVMKRSKRVLLAAGGLAPELWTNGYPLGNLDQEIVICDTDDSLVPYLEKLLGGKLADFGIKFWNRDVISLGHDELLKGCFDCIVANGFVSYHTKNPQKLEEIFKGFSNLLCADGWLFFDTQNRHPILLFDVLVLGWPQGMDTLDGPEAAAALLDPYLMRHGFVGIGHSTEEFDAEKGESPAGTFTVARKRAA